MSTVVDGVDDLPAGVAFVATVGVFDGMHRGHEAVVRATRDAARRLDATAVAITFEPHPELVLRGSGPPLLCDPLEKLMRLGRDGIDTVVVQAFDRTFAGQTAAEFIARLSAGRHLRGIVMSAESAFGRDRAGTAAAVAELGADRGFEVLQAPLVAVGGERISSSRIRHELETGRLSAAARQLGRRYAVIGEVVHGDGRGRTLGYPTANLAFPAPVALPRNGIYAVRVTWGGADPLGPERRADGVASLGVRPTFGLGGRVLEVHLLEFDEDLYGMRLRVEFVRRQRGERRFAGAEALVHQMDRDTERSREILRSSGP